MSPDYARILLNGMTNAGVLTRTKDAGQASIYSIGRLSPKQMQNGVTP